MTIQELYDWAKENDVTSCEVVVNVDNKGATRSIKPEIWTSLYTGYYEVEL